MSEPLSERQVLINLVASLSLADHMGDAYADSKRALALIGIAMPQDYEGSPYEGFWHQLAHYLATNHGATTVWGTSLVED